MPEPPEHHRPPYLRIVAAIRERIVAGELGPGAYVPSTREITREWGVAMATAAKVLATLRQEGWVEVVRGVGTVVRAETGSEQPRQTGHPPNRPRPPSERGPHRTTQPALTREAIVRAALAVVEEEGIEDLSMRRIAAELRVSTMALYRHVADRTDLVSAMIDAKYHDAQLPEVLHGDWRQVLESLMLWEWGILRKHSWIVRLTPATGPFLTPAVMAATERMMAAIIAEGRSADTALEIVTVLLAYTDGIATQGLLVEVEDQEFDPHHQDWWKKRAPELARIAARDRFPNVFSVSGPPDIDRIFTFGMKSLLDGLAPVVTACG